MNFKLPVILILGTLFFTHVIYSQDALKTVVAEEGDGIYSILRKEGISGDKYYVEFIELNKDNIKNGSMLQLGKTYIIPRAENSFKHMGKKIQLSQNTETALFTSDMHKLRRKGNALKNTVYYLLFDTFNTDNLQLIKNESKTRDEMAKSMAKELLEQGARVFLFEYDSDKNQSLGDYVEVINKRFLKYNGQYQRLLVMNIDQEILGENTAVSISHYEKSKESRRFANSIESIFTSKNVKLKSSRKSGEIFTDKANLYLAKNVLPAMTFIQVDEINNTTTKKTLLKADKEDLVDWITTGIQNDYTNLIFEDED